MLKIRDYVSVLDAFMRQFRSERRTIPVSIQKEQKKHQGIAQRRDHENVSPEIKTPPL